MEQQGIASEPVNQEPTLAKHAFKFGGIIGIVSILLTLIIYIIDYGLLADWKTGLIMFVVFIGLVIYGGINYRNQVGGFLAYGAAFQHSYISLMVGGLIGVLFSMLLYSVIDPALPGNLSDVALEKGEEMMRSFGAPEDKIDEQMDQMREDMPARFSNLGLLKQFGWSFLVNAVIAAITALFVKKKEPELV